MRLQYALLAFLMPVATALAQIPAPQLNLSGNIGCQGFPCLNNGTLQLSTDANHVMTTQETSALYLKVTSSVSLTATRNLIAPLGRFPFTIENATAGGQFIQIIGQSGTGVTIANGSIVSVWNDGTNFVQVGVAIPIPNSALANPSTTVNGQTCTLGSSCTTTFSSAIYTGCNTATETPGTGYCPLNPAFSSYSATESQVQQPQPVAATINNLYVTLQADPGNTNTVKITGRVAGSSSSLTCTITGNGSTATSCNDTTHSMSVTAGQLIDWQIVTTGISTATDAYISARSVSQ